MLAAEAQYVCGLPGDHSCYHGSIKAAAWGWPFLTQGWCAQSPWGFLELVYVNVLRSKDIWEYLLAADILSGSEMECEQDKKGSGFRSGKAKLQVFCLW